MKDRARTTQLSHAWVLSPQKWCEKIYDCWLKLLNFGIIQYVAMHNKYTMKLDFDDVNIPNFKKKCCRISLHVHQNG